jgi:hypothetical protein
MEEVTFPSAQYGQVSSYGCWEIVEIETEQPDVIDEKQTIKKLIMKMPTIP